MSNINHQQLWKWSLYLMILGVVLAIYLLYSQLFQPSFQPCRINALINCDTVIKTKWGWLFGVPIPIYGLIGYLVMLLAYFKKSAKILLYTAIFGTLFCLRMTIIELFIVKSICPVCMICQVVMIVLMIFGYKLQNLAQKS